MRKYFYTDGVEKYGPFSKDELKSQKLNRNTKVWYFGLSKWTELSELKEEFPEIILAIPPDLKPQIDTTENKNPKSKAADKKNLTDEKKEKLKNFSLIIGLIILIMLSVLTKIIIQNKSDSNLYNEIVVNSYKGEEDFDIYVQKFYRDLELYGIFPKKPKTTIIKFSNLDQLDNTTHIHGLSLGHNDDNRIEIYLNPSSWKRFSKPMRYFIMYHELAHDILNLNDLDNNPINEGKLMYPSITSYEKKNMDDFIESFHALFEVIPKDVYKKN